MRVQTGPQASLACGRRGQAAGAVVEKPVELQVTSLAGEANSSQYSLVGLSHARSTWTAPFSPSQSHGTGGPRVTARAAKEGRDEEREGRDQEIGGERRRETSRAGGHVRWLGCVCWAVEAVVAIRLILFGGWPPFDPVVWVNSAPPATR